MLAKRIQASKKTEALPGNGQFIRLERTINYRVLIIPQRACIECPIKKPIRKLLDEDITNTDPPMLAME
jgi:hypothetical protein